MNTRSAFWAACWILSFQGLVRADVWDFKAGLGSAYGTNFSTAEKDGVGFTAYLELGLTETWSLTCQGGYISHWVGEGQAYSLSNLGLGILYNIDVLEVVPYLSLRLGWLHKQVHDSADSSGLGLAFAVGFDYLWTDNFTFGLAAEYHGMLTDLPGFPGYVAFIARLGFRIPY